MFNMKYQINKFYDENDLEQINNQLKFCSWECGLKSVNFAEGLSRQEQQSLKKCFQTTLPNELLFKSVDKCGSFLDFTIPVSSTSPIISKTPPGGYYNAHFDVVDNGHFSTTIFLSDPKSYDGGELCLYLDGKEEKFKLDAGYGITYETGIAHRVNLVTRGDRIACVFWTKTKIPVMDELYKYRYYIHMADRYLHSDFSIKTVETCEKFVNNLNIHFIEKANKIMRRWI